MSNLKRTRITCFSTGGLSIRKLYFCPHYAIITITTSWWYWRLIVARRARARRASMVPGGCSRGRARAGSAAAARSARAHGIRAMRIKWKWPHRESARIQCGRRTRRRCAQNSPWIDKSNPNMNTKSVGKPHPLALHFTKGCAISSVRRSGDSRGALRPWARKNDWSGLRARGLDSAKARAGRGGMRQDSGAGTGRGERCCLLEPPCARLRYATRRRRGGARAECARSTSAH